VTDRGAIIIPAYNEASTLGAVIESVRAHAGDVDIIVVDDGSRDRTADIASGHRAAVVRHRLNLGYTSAVQTGLLYALQRGYRHAITFDADGQHDAATLPLLLRRAAEADRPDIVIGSRFVASRRYTAPLGRSIGMRVFSVLTGVVGGQRIYDTTSGLKLMSADAIAAVARLSAGDLHSEVIVYCLRRGLRIVEVPVTMHPRSAGISMHGAMSAVAYPLRTILAMLLLSARARREAAAERATAKGL
jgi:glycosyltransferase involved in cell wall biosynthesis